MKYFKLLQKHCMHNMNCKKVKFFLLCSILETVQQFKMIGYETLV